MLVKIEEKNSRLGLKKKTIPKEFRIEDSTTYNSGIKDKIHLLAELVAPRRLELAELVSVALHGNVHRILSNALAVDRQFGDDLFVLTTEVFNVLGEVF